MLPTASLYNNRGMEATRITRDRISVVFSPEETTFLVNAINEALEAVEEWEFQTRTGETRTRAREIQAQLASMLDESSKQNAT